MQLIDTLEKCGVINGWEFQRSGKQMRMSEFGPSFFNELREVQIDMPEMIHSYIYLLEDFALARSKRRGAMKRTQIFKSSKRYH